MAVDRPASGAPDVLRVDGLSFAYPGQPALFTHWSHAFAPGVTLVQGGESSGKTTLLRLLAGDLKADAGQLAIRGVTLEQHPVDYRQQVLRTDPRSEAFDQVTVLDFLASIGARFPAWDPAALPALLDGLSLTVHQHKPLYMLSTGSKRKVWLAAAFASGAALTLVDEPFAALDRPSMAFVLARLRDMASQNTCAWVVADYEAPGDVPLMGVVGLGA